MAIEERPIFPTPRRFLAACYAYMGLPDEARATVARLRALTPEVIPTYPLPFRDPAHRELYYTGLRLALGEETGRRITGVRTQPTAELNLLMNVGLGVDPASSIAAASMTGFGALQPVADDAAYGRRCPFPAVRYATRIPAQKIESAPSVPVG